LRSKIVKVVESDMIFYDMEAVSASAPEQAVLATGVLTSLEVREVSGAVTAITPSRCGVRLI